MNLRATHKLLTSRRRTLVVGLLVFIVFRLLYCSDFSNITFWASTAIQLTAAFLLLYINSHFALTSRRTLLPAFFYILFTGTNISLFDQLTGSIVTLLVIFCLMILFKSYQLPSSQWKAFDIGLIVAAGSILSNPALLLLPLFWYGFYKLRCLNIRMFFANLLGVVTVYLFVLAWAVYSGKYDFFISQFTSWRNVADTFSFSFDIKSVLIFLFVFVYYILAGANVFTHRVTEKVQTRIYLSYLYAMALVVFALSLILQKYSAELSLIIYIPTSLVFAHFFSLKNNKQTTQLLIACIVFFLLTYIWDILSFYQFVSLPSFPEIFSKS